MPASPRDGLDALRVSNIDLWPSAPCRGGLMRCSEAPKKILCSCWESCKILNPAIPCRMPLGEARTSVLHGAGIGTNATLHEVRTQEITHNGRN